MSEAEGGQSLEGRWLAVVSGERRGPGAALARLGLSALAGPYWLGLQANHAVYRLGLKAQTQPPLPVVSVGNLTLGGAGKTTTVRYLARRLSQAGARVGVVLRGHGGQARGEALLAHDGAGARLAPEVTGDEAAEYGRLLPQTPIAIGKRRELALGLLAERGVQVGLLDDGFQYFRMARLVDLVLLSAHTTPHACRLFPRGLLREPWSHLQRATQIWLTHTDQVPAAQVDAWRGLVSHYAPGTPVVLTRHEPRELADLATGTAVARTDLAGARVVAVCGLGNPASFEQSLVACGAEVVPCRFPDHHRYRPEDWEQAAAVARAHDARFLVTTEKDAVKVDFAPCWPTLVLRSELAVTAGEDHVQTLLTQVVGSLGD